MTPPLPLHVIHYFVCGSAIVANLWLLQLIWKRTPSKLKSYSVLLAVDAVGQLTTSLCACIMFTRVIPVGAAVFSVVNGPAQFTGSREFCAFLDSAMIFGYSHYNIILVTCFSFRYFVLLGTTPSVKATALGAVMVSFPSIIFMILYAQLPLATLDEIHAKLLLKGPSYVIDGLVIAPEDATHPIFVIGLTYACFPIYPVEAVLVLGTKIYKFLAANAVHMSDRTRATHRQIVAGLVAQAFLPILGALSMFCLFLGRFAIVESDILEYGMHILSEPINILSPLATIYFVQPYRRASTSLIVKLCVASGCCREKTVVKLPQKIKHAEVT